MTKTEETELEEIAVVSKKRQVTAVVTSIAVVVVCEMATRALVSKITQKVNEAIIPQNSTEE